MGRKSGLDIKRIRTMESGRMTFGRSISFSFFGHHMNHDGSFHSFSFLNDPDQSVNIMTVNRSKISNSHILEKHTGNHQLFKAILSSSDFVYQRITISGSHQCIIDTFL